MSSNNTNELSHEQLAKQELLYKQIYEFERPIPTIEAGPVINRILVLPNPLSALTKSGIIIPDTAQMRPDIGTVLAIGPGRTLDNGIHIQTVVAVGDKVQYGKYSGTWVYDEQLDVMLMLMIDADCFTRKPQPKLVAKEEQAFNSEAGQRTVL